MKIILFILLFIVFSCGEAVKSKKSTANETLINRKSKSKNVDSKIDSIRKISNKIIIKDSISYKNGIEIKWKNRGEGEKLKSGEVVFINFLVDLEDGTHVGGNLLMKDVRSYPIMVGFNNETKGLDFALKELTVGDVATIKIPSNLAYGKKGFGLIPSNENLIVAIKILKRIKPSISNKDFKVWNIQKSNATSSLEFNLNTELGFHFLASSKYKKNIINTLNEKSLNKLKYNELSKNNLFKKVLKNSKSGRKLFILTTKDFKYDLGDFSLGKHANSEVFFYVNVLSVKVSK